MKFNYIICNIFLVCSLACGNSFLNDTAEQSNMQVKYAAITGTTFTSATFVFGCSTETEASIVYGKAGSNSGIQVSLYSAREHVFTIGDLDPETDYTVQGFCGELFSTVTTYSVPFWTGEPGWQERLRGIWMVGGIGAGAEIVAEIDLYDPVTGKWIEGVTHIPTPRAFPQIVSHNQKIFIMGGLEKIGGVYSPSRVVEVYDPLTNSWETMASLNTPLQGGLAASVGEAIYLVGGSQTNNSTGGIANEVQVLYPGIGSTGTWLKKTSSTAFFGTSSARVDMAGCEIDGVLLMSGGRDSNNQTTSDAYLPAVNATSGLNEASGSGLHGSASTCYRPRSTDPYPGDTPAMLIVGGSSLRNFNLPVTALSPSSGFSYYATGDGTNTMVSGPILPTELYYPAMEISYENRRAYVFGGAGALNNPTDTIYSIDLTNPTAGVWQVESSVMPRARYGHKAIILNR